MGTWAAWERTSGVGWGNGKRPGGGSGLQTEKGGMELISLRGLNAQDAVLSLSQM